MPPEIHEAFARYGAAEPARRAVPGDPRTAARRASRMSSPAVELHRLDLYREVYRPLGVEYQIAFTLPSSSQRVLGVALSRGERDFTARERDLLNLARPYLIQAYRNALALHARSRERGRDADRPRRSARARPDRAPGRGAALVATGTRTGSRDRARDRAAHPPEAPRARLPDARGAHPLGRGAAAWATVDELAGAHPARHALAAGIRDAPRTGSIETAITLYSGHDVLTSDDCPTSRFVRCSGKWKVVNTCPGTIRSVIRASC